MLTRLIPLNITIMLLLFSAPVASQAEVPILVAQIGRGAVQSIEWYPDGERIFVSTNIGAWIYTRDLQDIAHLPDVHLAALSPDGRRIAGVNAQGRLKLWDADTLEPLDTLDHNQIERVVSLAWSPDGQFFAAVGFQSSMPLMFVWDIIHDWSVINATHSSMGNLLWSPNGDYLVVYRSGGGLIWPTRTSGLALFSAFGEAVIRWQDNSTFLTLVWNEYVVIKRWDAATGELIEEIHGNGTARAYSADGRYLAVDLRDRVRIDALHGEQPSVEISLPLPEENNIGWISKLAWSGDDQRLAIGRSLRARSAAVPIVIANPAGQILHEFSGGIHVINDLVWSPDDRFLLAIDEAQQIMVLDTEAGTQVAATRLHSFVGHTLAWSPDSVQLAIGDALNNVTLWNMATNTPTMMLSGNDSVVSRIEWQIRGHHLALETKDYLPFDRGSFAYPRAQIWQLSGEAPERVTANFQPDPATPLNQARFSGDGTRLLVVASRELWVWSIDADEQQVEQYETLDYAPIDLLFGPSGEQVVYQADFAGGAASYRTEEQQQALWMRLIPYSDRVNTWSRSGELVSLIWDVWDHSYIPEIQPDLSRMTVGAGEDAYHVTPNTRLIGSTTAIDRGYISPFGAYVGAINTENNGMIWDGQTGSPVAWINDAANMVWSPDETLLVVKRTDGSVWLLESDGTILTQIPTLPHMQAAVGDFYWSPDSRHIAHLHDGVIDVWQMQG